MGASAAVCLAVASPAAQARAPLTKARFLHAVPMAAAGGADSARTPAAIQSSYGKPSPYHACHPGPARVELKVEGQAKPAATANLDIGRGRYTVIAVPEGKGVGLRVYKDGNRRCRARPACGPSTPPPSSTMRRCAWTARRRADRADKATGYTSVPPGRHDLSVTRPGGAGGALASASGVPLVAGSASTAIVVGSGGSPRRCSWSPTRRPVRASRRPRASSATRGDGGGLAARGSRGDRGRLARGHRLSAGRSPAGGRAPARGGHCRSGAADPARPHPPVDPGPTAADVVAPHHPARPRPELDARRTRPRPR